MIDLPSGVLPVRDLATTEILYGARETSLRYELLSHDPTTGVDSFAGLLDGVQPGGSLSWRSGAAVKKSGTVTVSDLETACGGFRRISDVDLLAERVRPVRVIDGLPDEPLGVYVFVASPEQWSGTGREYTIELLEKTTVIEQDAVEETFTAETGTPILSIIQSVIASAGEQINVDGSDLRELSQPAVWPAGTSKLRIVNDLLAALNYNSLWMDGEGQFRATPWIAPADRSIRYSLLNDEAGNRLVRELTDGAQSIYSPEWKRDRDTYKVPNRVIAVAAGAGSDAPLSGVVENTDPGSPFSIPSRGRTIVRVVEGVDVPDGTTGEIEAFLEERARQALIAASSVQATVEVSCLPIPLELLEAMRFASTPAGVDARHIVRAVSVPLTFDGMLQLELSEVVTL